MNFDLDAHLQPISEQAPCGGDVRVSDDLDRLKQARRADDTLNRGDWEVRELKTADWPEAISIASNILRTKSKDLEVACFLVEALCHTDGFSGTAAGFTLLERLLQAFWGDLYPKLEDDGIDWRANILAWLNNNIPQAIGHIPLAQSAEHGDLGLFDWEQSRDVERLSKSNPEYFEQALADGKVMPSDFDDAVATMPQQFYADLVRDINTANQQLGTLILTVRSSFGEQGPSFGDLSDILKKCQRAGERLAEARGVKIMEDVESAGAEDQGTEIRSDNQEEPPGHAPARDNTLGAGQVSSARSAIPRDSGPLQSRDDALRQLREISEFFRQIEPQSPVPYLIDRAVQWANMPLDRWLEQLIKEDHILEGIREHLGVTKREES